MRVRIRKSIFTEMQDLAEEESDKTGEHVTVSDIVRAACMNYLLIQDSLRRMECIPPSDIEEDVWFVERPMLRVAANNN